MPAVSPTLTARRLPASSSLLLDGVRFGASVTVAAGHITQSPFSTGWPDMTIHAVEAVAVFFVLSGFVIRYVTRLKYGRLSEYSIDRASRIYSVVVPAVLFTVLADAFAMRANRGWYLAHWGQYMDHPVSRLVQNLLFTSQFWSRSTRLFSNGPLWSLSYECLYYAIYGSFFYLRGALRWLVGIGLIILGGAHIALLFPLWVLGCVLYEIYDRLSARGITWRTHLWFLGAGALGVLVSGRVVAALFALKHAMASAILSHHHRPPNLHWMLDYYRVGIPAAFLMLWMLIAVDRATLNKTSRVSRVLMVLAEGTFPLYLVHFPLYVLIAAMIPYNHASAFAKSSMVVLAITFGVLLAFPTNWFKDRLRSWLRHWFVPGVRMPAARSAQPAAS